MRTAFFSKKLLVTVSLLLPLLQPAHAAEWGYEGKTGPSSWADIGPETKACGGIQQSPVDLSAEKAIEAEPVALELQWKPFKPAIVDNGHSIVVEPGEDGGKAVLGEADYKLIQFHFHHGSEHTVDGVKYDAEAHFVHRSEKNGDLLVVGVFIEEGDEHRLIDEIWKGLPEGVGKQELASSIDPAMLLPSDKRYFHYQGSLTTPGCHEIVTWHVLGEPVTMSKEQMALLAERYPNNFRPVQPLNRRYILKGNG